MSINVYLSKVEFVNTESFIFVGDGGRIASALK